jgi:sialate O-acetylesterase
MQSTKVFLAAMIFVLLPVSLCAQATLPEIFRDHMVLQRDQPIPVWGKAAAGAAVRVKLDAATQKTTAASDGSWRVKLPSHVFGGPFLLTVTAGKDSTTLSDVMIGDVWLASGQSNMAMVMRPEPPYTLGVLDYANEIANANSTGVRAFIVPEEGDFPEQKEMHGSWHVAVGQQTCNVSAVAYYFARKVNMATGIPIGIITAAVGSTGIDSWLPMDINRKYQAANMAQTDKLLQDHAAEVAEYERLRPEWDLKAEAAANVCSGLPTPAHTQPFPNFLFKRSALYNSMIYPLQQMPIKGVIWYQGEADARYYAGYANKMRELVGSWRAGWKQPEMPFYFVQLTNIAPEERQGLDFDPKDLNFTNQREQQRVASLTIPNVGMAVTADVGDPMQVHPRNKKAMGERLALLALAHDYGQKIIANGPLYASMSVQESQLRIKFEMQGSTLRTKTGSNPYGFEIAGEDGVYHPALSAIEGADTVVLSSPLVKEPKNARYAWHENPTMSVYNAEGLPASGFSTETVIPKAAAQ